MTIKKLIQDLQEAAKTLPLSEDTPVSLCIVSSNGIKQEYPLKIDHKKVKDPSSLRLFIAEDENILYFAGDDPEYTDYLDSLRRKI